jgi:hypothetical protein
VTHRAHLQTEFSFSGYRWHAEIYRHDNICLALSNSRSLKTVTSRPGSYWSSNYAPLQPGLAALIENGKRVVMHCYRESAFSGHSHVKPELLARIQFITPTTSADLPPSFEPLAAPNAFWKPMQDASAEVRVAIWTRILEHLLVRLPPTVQHSPFAPLYIPYQYQCFGHQAFDLAMASRCIRVSSDFHVRTLTLADCDVALTMSSQGCHSSRAVHKCCGPPRKSHSPTIAANRSLPRFASAEGRV